MKPYYYSIPIGLLLAAVCARGQGILVYDQGFDTEPYAGAGGRYITPFQPIGQSFTPALSSVGFIRLVIISDISDLSGAVIVNLRTGSITGPILASTEPVSLPPGFHYFTNFFFATPVSVTPGGTYYFQPVVLSGGQDWQVTVMLQPADPDYPGGTAFLKGTAKPNADLWFREGIVALPEPSVVLLFLCGAGFLAWRRCKRART